MIYNLLFDTKFNNTDTYWKCENCYYENGKFISKGKVFGIYQEITLAGLTTLYLRCSYNILKSNVTKVMIGVQDKTELSVNRAYPKQNKWQKISVVETNSEETIIVHIIFESTSDYNEVTIREPLLCDLQKFDKSTFLKPVLDRTIKYRDGYTYNNVLGYSELTKDILDLEPAKIGCIFDSLEALDINIDAKLNKGSFYLIKLDFLNINDLGQVYFTYGVMKSKTVRDQSYLMFRATDNCDLVLHILPQSVLPYKVQLKYILLTEITTQKFDNIDIPYLPYIK